MMQRRDLIVGNWKMNANHLEAIQMVQKLSYRLERPDSERVEVVVAPPYTALRSVQTVIEADRLPIGLGAQNCDWRESGAYTGEISAPMLAKLGVGWVILGHSERRAHFGETDETVNLRAKAVLASGMHPIVCVGETLDQRDTDQTDDVVLTQVQGGMRGITGEQVATMAVAYEPVWAIGTGRNADPDTAGAVVELIRDTVRDMVGDAADSLRILYGGSVNAGNIKGFMSKRHIDGALVGGASLDPDTFAAIIRYWI